MSSPEGRVCALSDLPLSVGCGVECVLLLVLLRSAELLLLLLVAKPCELLSCKEVCEPLGASCVVSCESSEVPATGLASVCSM